MVVIAFVVTTCSDFYQLSLLVMKDKTNDRRDHNSLGRRSRGQEKHLVQVESRAVRYRAGEKAGKKVRGHREERRRRDPLKLTPRPPKVGYGVPPTETRMARGWAAPVIPERAPES